MSTNPNHHASDLRFGVAVCDHSIKASDTVRLMAATSPLGQELVGCLTCRRMMGLELSYVRTLGLDETAVATVEIEAPGVVCVAVPMFGHVLVTRVPNADGDDYAILARPDKEPQRRELTRVGQTVTVPMLHKANRIDLVLENLQPR